MRFAHERDRVYAECDRRSRATPARVAPAPPHHPVAAPEEKDHPHVWSSPPASTSSSSAPSTSRSSSANDPATGLRAIIAIHSTALGPALGGTRFYPYATTADAVATSSTSRAGWPTRPRSPGSTSAAARPSSSATRPSSRPRRCCAPTAASCSRSNGRYFTACDVGTFSEDMDDIARECDFVTGRTVAHGGAGDSSVLTAYGVFQGMRAAAEQVWGEPTLAGPHRRRRRRRQGRPPPGRPPHRGRRDGRRHRRVRPRRRAVRDEHPQVHGRRLDRRAGRDASSTSTPPARSAARSPTRCVEVLTREDRLRRGQQPARPPGHREAARGARHPLRPRLLRELRRPDPGRRRARGLLASSAPSSARTGIFDTTRRVFELAAADGVPPAIAADRLAERRMREVGRLRGIWLS